jgi:hypothetical protein
VVCDMRYKRMALLVVARCHINLWEDTPYQSVWRMTEFRVKMRFVISAKEGQPRDLHRDIDRADRMMDKTLDVKQ